MNQARSRRWILANLDAEAEMAGRTVAKGASQVASAFGSLLRVFAQPEDLLLLPRDFDPERMAEVTGLPHPETRRWNQAPQKVPAALLPWCSTRRANRLAERVPRSPEAEPGDLPLDELLWQVPLADPEVVTNVHHRRFHLETAQALGCALPGSEILSSLAALEDHLGRVPATTRESWVLKAGFSAAGRGHFLGRGLELEARDTSRVASLFRKSKVVLFEPWVERVADFGLCGVVTDRRVCLLGRHRLEVDPRGSFCGVEVMTEKGPPPWPQTFHGLPEDIFSRVGGRLQQRGYRGPFGLDGWVHRGKDGELHCHPLGEINARMTFGMVALALDQRLRRAAGAGERGNLFLGFGTPRPTEDSSWLVQPDATGRGGVWMERVEARRHRG